MNIQCQIESPVGRLYLIATPQGLRGIYWNKKSAITVKTLNSSDPVHIILKKASSQLEEYFAGQRKNFDIPLDLEGTTFQKKVWAELVRIPFGKTVAYRDIASKIKNPKAVRAVGSANGKNPVCIVVPCHRVIAADGSIGGYSAGISIKKRLLELEEIALA